MESGYISSSDARNEVVWTRKFIVELGMSPIMHDHVVLNYDNTGVIANTKDPRSHSVAKHIPQRYHVIRRYIHDNEVNACKIHTDMNVVDPLTKPLPQAKHHEYQESMGVRPFPNVN
jgi:hypothetical protein